MTISSTERACSPGCCAWAGCAPRSADSATKLTVEITAKCVRVFTIGSPVSLQKSNNRSQTDDEESTPVYPAVTTLCPITVGRARQGERGAPRLQSGLGRRGSAADVVQTNSGQVARRRGTLEYHLCRGVILHRKTGRVEYVALLRTATTSYRTRHHLGKLGIYVLDGHRAAANRVMQIATRSRLRARIDHDTTRSQQIRSELALRLGCRRRRLRRTHPPRRRRARAQAPRMS